MSRDPLYQEILKRLGGTVDPQTFEACVPDLLRTAGYAVVPVPGGNDAGMDGAVADGVAEPFPVIVTTGKDCIGNLTQNLESRLADRCRGGKAIFATSQALTAKRRRNLEKRARELGFVLVQTYTRESLAQLLYHNPRWCRELLDLTGDPPALSAIPPSARFFPGDTIIGRQEDLAWLRETEGDLVLKGQPGSGKTFLAYLYTGQANGLFVVHDDAGRIADGMRSQEPAVLIVDDAHANTEILRTLLHLRKVVGANFSIVATSWPYEAESVQTVLGLPTSHVRGLGLLTRDEIVEVVKLSGIHGPPELVRELVDQAEGRPGLAMTLSRLSIQGDVQDVVLGRALARSVMTSFERMVGPPCRVYLAAFAIGGDAGMSIESVANALGKPAVDVKDAVTRLEVGGVLMETRDARLSVRPRRLRHALVRDVFFSDATSLYPDRLVTVAPDRAEVARTLVGAKAVGGVVPRDLLSRILEQAGSLKAWTDYAWLGRDEAGELLKRHPEMIVDLAEPTLHNAPDSALPFLFQRAIGDERPLGSTLAHPLRKVEDWVQDVRPGTGEGVARRRALMEQVVEWLSAGGDERVGLKALGFGLLPGFERSTRDPGKGMTYSLQRGLLAVVELEGIEALWPKALGALRLLKITKWALLIRIVEVWAHPSAAAFGPTPEDSYRKMQDVARRMVADIVPLAVGCSGALRRLSDLAHHLRLDVPIRIDPAFRVLLPKHDWGDWEAAREREVVAVRAMAKEWAKERAIVIAERIAHFEEEVESAEVTGLSWLALLCDEIATQVESRVEWAHALIESGCSPAVIPPFLAHAASVHESGYDTLLLDCLRSEDLKPAAVSVVLQADIVTDELRGECFARLEGTASVVKDICMLGNVPEPNLQRLLSHEDALIGGAAAIAEWQRSPHGVVRHAIARQWRGAIIRHAKHEYWLTEILGGDSELARGWLAARIAEESNVLYLEDDTVTAAVGALGRADRERLLDSLGPGYHARKLLALLVGNDAELYRKLLENQKLKSHHLAPLGGLRGLACLDFAKLALERGYTPADVAHAIYDEIQVWCGNESDLWGGWAASFDPLCSHDDPRIRQVGEIGRARAEQERDRALERERNEDVFGR